MSRWLIAVLLVPTAALLTRAGYIWIADWRAKQRTRRRLRELLDLDRVREQAARLRRSTRSLDDAVQHDAARHTHDTRLTREKP